MNTSDALSAIIKGSGKSSENVSRSMGFTRSYLSVTLARKSIPKVDTFARIADACGYDLALEKRDNTERIIIEPDK